MLRDELIAALKTNGKETSVIKVVANLVEYDVVSVSAKQVRDDETGEIFNVIDLELDYS